MLIDFQKAFSQSTQVKIPKSVAEWVRALDWRSGCPGYLRQLRFGTLAIPFTQLCQCLSQETLKAVGPFYLEIYECFIVSEGKERKLLDRPMADRQDTKCSSENNLEICFG